MTNAKLVKEAETKIQQILLGLEEALSFGTMVKRRIDKVDVDTRNFSNLAVTIFVEDGMRW